MSFIDWGDVVARYADVSKVGGSAEVNSSHIAGAEAQLNGALAQNYTVPFSSNNATAKDIGIDLAYVRIMARYRPKETAALRDMVMKRIESLQNGEEIMILDDGTTIAANIAGVVYSNTQDYYPTFGNLDTEEQLIDPDLIEAEIVERS